MLIIFSLEFNQFFLQCIKFVLIENSLLLNFLLEVRCLIFFICELFLCIFCCLRDISNLFIQKLYFLVKIVDSGLILLDNFITISLFRLSSTYISFIYVVFFWWSKFCSWWCVFSFEFSFLSVSITWWHFSTSDLRAYLSPFFFLMLLFSFLILSYDS